MCLTSASPLDFSPAAAATPKTFLRIASMVFVSTATPDSLVKNLEDMEIPVYVAGSPKTKSSFNATIASVFSPTLLPTRSACSLVINVISGSPAHLLKALTLSRVTISAKISSAPFAGIRGAGHMLQRLWNLKIKTQLPY